ncbi:MAG: DUF115 domain-containing protein [Desulfobacula sp.]|jgi:Tfp pilus assembly protein PilF|nr:DUF115 domain-containing protein [Desulfobacula sp.]
MGFAVQNYISRQNFDLLKKNHPLLLEQLKALTTGPTGEVVKGPGDQLNLKVDNNGKMVLIHPEQDPESDQNYFLSNVPDGFSGVEVILGMGLGYAAKAILQQRKNIRNLVIIENDPGIFLQALKYMDLTDLLGDPKVIIGLAPDNPEVLLKPVQKGILLEDSQILEHPVIVPIFEKAYGRIRKMVFEHINHFNIAGATKVKFGEKIVKNRFDHLKSIGHYFKFESLINKFEGMPAYIAAGGPSLDSNIHFLKKVKNKAVILSVDTALPAFLDNDIMPDFVSSIDYKDLIYEKIAHKINDISVHTGLLTYTSTTPIVQKNFPGNRKFFLFTENGIDSWLNTLVKGKHFFASGPSVAHLNLIAAKVMGCSPIIFIGQDLSYSTANTHSKSAVLTHRDSLKRNLETKEDLLWVKGVEGSDVRTNRGYENMKTTFERLILHNPGEYINCSTGGVHIEGTTYMPLENVVELYHSRSISVSKILSQSCSRENKIDNGMVVDVLKKDLDIVKQVFALVRKVENILKKVTAELPGIKKKWKKNSILPKRIKMLLINIDKVNNKIDGYDRVWQILEDMTTLGLRKNEQMAFEIQKLEGITSQLPQWLEKTIERLLYVNSVRIECLDLLEKGINEVVQHIAKEMTLLKSDMDDIKTISALAELYINSREYSLARPLVEKCYEVDKNSAQANFFMGCMEVPGRCFDRMDSYFLKAIGFDKTYEGKIHYFRYDIGDQYIPIVKHLKKNDFLVAKKFLWEGLQSCPSHEKLQDLLADYADQDIKIINESDAKGNLNDQKEVIQYWIEIMSNFSNVHTCLSNKHFGIFYFSWGKIKFLSGLKDEASILFNKSIGYLPEDSGLVLKIADLLLCSYDYDNGLPYLNKAIGLDSANAIYWEGFGDFLFQNGKYGEGLSAYEQALQYFPKKNEILEKIVQHYLQIGNKLHGEGNFDEAEKSYKQGIHLCPDSSPSQIHLYNNMGSALKNIKKFDSAMSAYDKALEIDSSYAEALYNKGELFETLGHHESAVNYYEEAIKNRPDFIVAYNRLGNLLLVMGHSEKAEQIFQKVKSQQLVSESSESKV